MSTRFVLLKGEEECFVNVTHESPPHHTPGAPSRVRVDSIGLEVASCVMACHVSHYPGDTKRLADRGRSCAAGADRGERGYASPACFANGTTACKAALAKDDGHIFRRI